MSSKAEQQDLAFQGLREKIPWYISARNAVLRNPNMLIGIIFISLVVTLALLCPLLIKMGILRDPFLFDPQLMTLTCLLIFSHVFYFLIH